MPRPGAISKQRATAITNGQTQTSKSSGLLAEAIPIADMGDNPIHMILYGRNRIGKTTLACQFPKPLVLVSLEPANSGGGQSVKKMDGIQWLHWKESAKVERLGHELKEDLQGVRTVVIDSGTSLDDIVLAEVCGWNERAVMLKFPKKGESPKVSSDEYTERSEKVRQVLRPYLELACNVIITANEKDHNPPEGRKNAMVRGLQAESFFAGAMSAGTIRWLQDGCEVCQLYMDKETKPVTRTIGGKPSTRHEETGRLVRRLRTSYHPNYAAGLRSCDPLTVPEYIEAETPEEMYQKLMAVINGENS